MCRTLTDLVARGCLPIGVSSVQDSVVFAPIVELARPVPCLLQPRFSDAVLAYRGDEFYAVPAAEFAKRAAHLSGASTPRLIAHTSRCGSTLLANLLALWSTNLVLKEPGFLIQAVTRLIRAVEVQRQDAAAELVRALLHYLGALAHAHSRRLVIKLTSWTAPVLTQLTPAWEPYRWLLLYRDPAEVVASLVATPPGWWRDTQARADVLTFISATGSCPTLEERDPVKCYAQLWRAVVEPFTRRSAGACAFPFGVADYADLRQDPVAALRRVHAGLDLGGVDELPAGFTETCSRYSKAAAPVPFDPGGTHRRPPLSPQDRATVQRLTDAAFRQVRALGQQAR